MKFLIEGCLSPRLAQPAIGAGHVESIHVAHRGLAGMQDWTLAVFAVDGGWTLVTRNSVDFRGPADAPGNGGEYRNVDAHAGLARLNGDDMDRRLQLDLFAAVLEDLAGNPDLANMRLEATMAGAGQIVVERYALPVAQVTGP